MPVEVYAPGKLILIGEYAVLEGAPAMVTAVERYAVVSIEESQTGLYTLSAPAIGINHVKFTPDPGGMPEFQVSEDRSVEQKLQFFQTVFARIWQAMTKENQKALDIRIDSSAFYLSQNVKLGLGSSAAVTTALTQGLSAVWHKKLSHESLFAEALMTHHEAQGKLGSGIDIAASVFGGVLSYIKKTPIPKVRNIGLSRDIIVLPVWTGYPASTRELVNRVMELKVSRPDQYQQIISGMSQISMQAVEAWAGGNTDNFLMQIVQYEQMMNELGELSQAPIISEVHSRIRKIVHKYDGVYKPSGAGGGDLGLAFWKAQKFSSRLENELKAEGIQPVPLSFDTRGTIIQ